MCMCVNVCVYVRVCILRRYILDFPLLLKVLSYPSFLDFLVS